jgi:pimeloyl-ACP methyl ester carboxylesterase
MYISNKYPYIFLSYMKEFLVVGALLVLGLFVSPQAVFADVIQSDRSTSSPWVAPGYMKYQTLGMGLSGTLNSLDISYFADTSYYGVKVVPRLEECSSVSYSDCIVVSEAVVPPEYGPLNGIKAIDFVDYALNHCKYYRISLFAVGPFGSMGTLYYHGAVSDTYAYGAYSGGGIPDIYFVLHGVDRLDRSANTSENLCVDPVIIVPGLLGSFEKGGVLLMDPILHAYDDLVATLEANGYVASSTLFTFPYDWRNSNVYTALLLKQKINGIKAVCNCSKVDIVAHSMGGLVTRQYVQSDTYGNDIDQVIFLATPHLGSPKAYLAWEGGAFPVPSISDAVVYAILRSEAKHSGFSDVFDYVQNRPITSIKELLPIYDYLSSVNTETGVATQLHYPSGYPVNTFLNSLNITIGRLSRVRYENIVGDTGITTIGNLRISTSSSSVRWQHGQPQDLILSSSLELVEGDKTVPLSSAGVTGVNNTFDSEHTDIMDESISYVFSKLSNRIIGDLIVNSNIRYLMFSLFSPVDMTVTSPDGKKIGYISEGEINEISGSFYSGNSTENEFIVIPSPLDGEYKIEAVGTGDGEYTVAVSSISGDNVVDTEYTGTTMVGDVSKLVLDVDTSSLSPNLAIAPEPIPVIVEVPDTVAPVPVARSGGGGGRRSIQQSTITTTQAVTPNNPNKVNPDTFMIIIDIPVEKFIANVGNGSNISIPRTNHTGVTRPKTSQTAAVISTVDNQPIKAVFTDKIKQAFSKIFNWLKK